MRVTTTSALLSALSAIDLARAAPPLQARDVDTRYPYKGPEVPVGDWVDGTVNGNGKGFPRLVEAPAVAPSSNSPTNNVNVIQISYIPDGVNIHYQTPFGLGSDPEVKYGSNSSKLNKKATGKSTTYVYNLLTEQLIEMLIGHLSQQLRSHPTLLRDSSNHTMQPILPRRTDQELGTRHRILLPNPCRQRHNDIASPKLQNSPRDWERQVFHCGRPERHGLHQRSRHTQIPRSRS